MAKRKLSKQQLQRIRQRRAAQRPAPGGTSDASDGPTLRGLVISHFGTQADVEAEDGLIHRCHLRANLGDIAAGDQVLWQPGSDDHNGVIESVLPRTSELLRPDSYGKLKVVAANVTRLVITIAPEPAAHVNLIDRYLVAAHALDIEPFILINKTDLLEQDSPLPKLIDQYKALGYPVLQVSAKAGIAMQTLKAELGVGTSVFVGQSGVGKSSLIQALLPGEQIKIGKLSEGAKKGRHTTTHATLYHFEFGGNCIDSPGIREFGLWHLNASQVAAGFIEFHEFMDQCRFRNCQHQGEPGCALQAALQSGAISAERFASYRQIVESLAAVTVMDNEPIR